MASAVGNPSSDPGNPTSKSTNLPATPSKPSNNPLFHSMTTPPRLSPRSPSRTTIYSDRFIPCRLSSNFSLFDVPSSSPTSTTGSSSDLPARDDGTGSGTGAAYDALLRSALFGKSVSQESPGSRASFSSSASSSPLSTPSQNIFRYKADVRRISSQALFGEESLAGASFQGTPKGLRKISRAPYKVLDAPALQDDFYLNLVDWSASNILAVGLGHCVYLWNASSSKVTKLCDLGENDSVCSVGWAQRGTYLAVGTNLGKVQIWDASNCRKLRMMESHRMRVGTLAWCPSLLSSGSRDKTILHHDIRAQEDYVNKLAGHKSEVCGLKWSYDSRELASGGNDNRLFVWNQHSSQPVHKYSEHTAAVKAIAWSPHLHGLLASGGGTADRCIRFWNTTTNTQLNCIDTGSQVCNLVWSKNVDEIVSTHGYSQNQIIVWRYPKLSKLATLTGHTYRVLYLAISPDGQTIVTGAGDETLRFWNVFPSPKSQNSESLSSIGTTSFSRSYIR